MRVGRPNELELLIHNEVIHDRDNWLYQLEGQAEAPEPPQTPPKPKYHPAPSLDIS